MDGTTVGSVSPRHGSNRQSSLDHRMNRARRTSKVEYVVLPIAGELSYPRYFMSMSVAELLERPIVIVVRYRYHRGYPIFDSTVGGWEC